MIGLKNKRNNMKKLFFAFSLIIFALSFSFIEAEMVGETQDFYIQSDYDLQGREEISATLVKKTSKLYFYIDQDYWYSLSYHEQNQVRNSLEILAGEFEKITYPLLTRTFGSEWKPGVDNMEEITVLYHQMKNDVGGYYNTGDEYLRIQVSDSNEREMVYLNTNHIRKDIEKMFLAHEFMHLISFAQKDKEYNVSEETWLNELRSEYASTLLNYSNLDMGNPFRSRLETFSENPNDPLCEWQNEGPDYGVISVFGHYLVDHYGIEILIDSLHSDEIGIESINYALEKNGFEEDFSQIFTDWSVAILINDCGVSEKYCYKDERLRNFRISPSLNFLPLNGKSSLVLSDNIKNWETNWYKFVGGKGDLKINFIGSSENIYKIPYLIKDFSGNLEVDFFDLDSGQKGEILISDFGKTVISITLIPTLQTKTSDFSEKDISLPFLLEASTIQKPTLSISFEKPISEMSKEEVLSKVSELEDILKQLKERISELTPKEETPKEEIPYSKFEDNLYYGLTNDERVEELQEFLKEQGSEIYPEGLVTGNFLGLTKKAVIRFQEKYADEILTPLGLTEGTGYFGPATRDKINKMLGY